jgi:hypothetical protein
MQAVKDAYRFDTVARPRRIPTGFLQHREFRHYQHALYIAVSLLSTVVRRLALARDRSVRQRSFGSACRGKCHAGCNRHQIPAQSLVKHRHERPSPIPAARRRGEPGAKPVRSCGPSCACAPGAVMLDPVSVPARLRTIRWQATTGFVRSVLRWLLAVWQQRSYLRCLH